MSKIIVILVFVVIIAGAIYFEKRRGNDMEAIAGRLGFSFQAGQQPLPDVLDQAGFDLFTQGPPNIKNRMWGERNGQEITLFDFHYDATTSGEGRRDTPVTDDHNSMERRSQTVVWIRAKATPLPDFDLSPNRLHQRTAAARFGLSPVSFDGHPAFRGHYILLARDAARIRRLFNDRVLDYLASQPGIVLESRGTNILFYRFEQLPNPTTAPELIADAEALLDLLSCSDC